MGPFRIKLLPFGMVRDNVNSCYLQIEEFSECGQADGFKINGRMSSFTEIPNHFLLFGHQVVDTHDRAQTERGSVAYRR